MNRAREGGSGSVGDPLLPSAEGLSVGALALRVCSWLFCFARVALWGWLTLFGLRLWGWRRASRSFGGRLHLSVCSGDTCTVMILPKGYVKDKIQ